VSAGVNGTKQILATTDPNVSVYIAWSPDGRRIAYNSGSGADVYLAHANGLDPTLLSGVATSPGDGVHTLLWSPDGTHLIAHQTLIDVVTGQQTLLPSDTVTDEAPSVAWSPDSSSLAQGAGNGIALIRPDGQPMATIDMCKP
jgi:WD40 repeat protein